MICARRLVRNGRETNFFLLTLKAAVAIYKARFFSIGLLPLLEEVLPFRARLECDTERTNLRLLAATRVG